MNTTVTAIIGWLSPAKGGRVTPPRGRYRTTVRFEEDPTWPDESWTLVVEPLETIGDERFMTARIGFLVDDAPRQVLHPGSRFELYEGRRMVATGLVADPAGAQSLSASDVMALLPV